VAPGHRAGAAEGCTTSIPTIATGAETITLPGGAPPQRPGGRLRSGLEHLWMLVPGALVVFLGFESGGISVGITAGTAAALGILLAVRVLTTPRPLSGLTVWGGLALAGLAALAAWTLISQDWSHSASRALQAFDLVALYLLLTALYAGVRQPPERLRTMIYGLIAGLAAVCGAALLTRTLPHTFPVGPQFETARLSYPLTYWNALGMLTALGAALSIHIASDRDAHRWARSVAAALTPVFASALILTFSRGAIASLVVLLVLYVALAPRLALVTAAGAAGAPGLVAAGIAYEARLLGTDQLLSPGAIGQGHRVALGVAVCMLAAAGLEQLLIARVEPRLRPPRVSPWIRRAPAAVVIVAVVALLPLEIPWAHRQGSSFLHTSVNSTAPAATRLGSVSNDGRLPIWHVALKAFESEPWRGTGAGTFPLQWALRRTTLESVTTANSLYLQTLAELGVVGAVCLAVFLLGLLIGAARPWRSRPRRPLVALAVAALVAWALHSAIDTDWQMPAVVVPVVALAASVGATGRTRSRCAASRRPAPWMARLARGLAATACVGVAVAPGLVAVSQADLNASLDAFNVRDCRAATAHAEAAHSVAGFRPEPLQMIGYCQARGPSPQRAVVTMRSAISRDPEDWEYHFALGIARAAAGENPLPALWAAWRLDPREGVTNEAIEALRHRPRSQWRSIALRLPLALP